MADSMSQRRKTLRLAQDTVPDDAKLTHLGNTEADIFECLIMGGVEQTDEDIMITFPCKAKKIGADLETAIIGPSFVSDSTPTVLRAFDGSYPVTSSNAPLVDDKLFPILYSPILPNLLNFSWLKPGKAMKGWITPPSASMTQWFERMSPLHAKWEDQRILELIRLGCCDLPFDHTLSTGLFSCWNPCINVFVLGFGFLTINLEDVAHLTGLSPTGLDIGFFSPDKKAKNTLVPDASLALGQQNKGYQTYLAEYAAKSTPIDVAEEILFLNFIFHRLMMGQSANVSRAYLQFAANIAAAPRRPLNLGGFLLAHLYRFMYQVVKEPLKANNTSGPLWLLSLWGMLYFPHLCTFKPPSVLVPEDLHRSYGYGFSKTFEGAASLDIIVQNLLSIKSRSPLFPCSAKECPYLDIWGSRRDFLIENCPKWVSNVYANNMGPIHHEHWTSLFCPRDLLLNASSFTGVEVYNPLVGGVQFGLTSCFAIPFIYTSNQPWSSRRDFMIGSKKMALEVEATRREEILQNIKEYHRHEVRHIEDLSTFGRYPHRDKALKDLIMDFRQRFLTDDKDKDLVDRFVAACYGEPGSRLGAKGKQKGTETRAPSVVNPPTVPGSKRIPEVKREQYEGQILPSIIEGTVRDVRETAQLLTKQKENGAPSTIQVENVPKKKQKKNKVVEEFASPIISAPPTKKRKVDEDLKNAPTDAVDDISVVEDKENNYKGKELLLVDEARKGVDEGPSLLSSDSVSPKIDMPLNREELGRSFKAYERWVKISDPKIEELKINICSLFDSLKTNPGDFKDFDKLKAFIEEVVASPQSNRKPMVVRQLQACLQELPVVEETIKINLNHVKKLEEDIKAGDSHAQLAEKIIDRAGAFSTEQTKVAGEIAQIQAQIDDTEAQMAQFATELNKMKVDKSEKVKHQKALEVEISSLQTEFARHALSTGQIINDSVDAQVQSQILHSEIATKVIVVSNFASVLNCL